MTFLVLNTNIYYSDYKNDVDDEDPCGQLSWLEKSLKEADNETEKVFIVAHVPPGTFERSPGKLNFNTPNNTFEGINKKYMEIVSRPGLSSKISAHLYGHLHTDTFRILLDSATRSTPVGKLRTLKLLTCTLILLWKVWLSWQAVSLRYFG